MQLTCGAFVPILIGSSRLNVLVRLLLSQQLEENAAIRRPMRAPPPVQKDGPRINEEIRVREVHLIDADGTNKGTVAIADALAAAQAASLDLVEISPNAMPPIVKLLDYGKYKYQEQKKAAEARKKQKVVEVKEIKMRPNIDDHDYDVKMRVDEAVLRGRRQGEGDLALPRPRDGAYGARHASCWTASRGTRRRSPRWNPSRGWKAARW